MDCQGVDCESIYAAVVNGGGWIHMTVKRRRSGGRSVHTAHLHCPRSSHHGLMLHTGVYIANILPGSPAAREGSLAIGDRVLNVCIGGIKSFLIVLLDQWKISLFHYLSTVDSQTWNLCPNTLLIHFPGSSVTKYRCSPFSRSSQILVTILHQTQPY